MVVQNTREWLESRKKLKERKKREAKEGRASDEPAAFCIPMGGSRSRSSAYSETTCAAGREAQEGRHRRGGTGDRWIRDES